MFWFFFLKMSFWSHSLGCFLRTQNFYIFFILKLQQNMNIKWDSKQCCNLLLQGSDGPIMKRNMLCVKAINHSLRISYLRLTAFPEDCGWKKAGKHFIYSAVFQLGWQWHFPLFHLSSVAFLLLFICSVVQEVYSEIETLTKKRGGGLDEFPVCVWECIRSEGFGLFATPVSLLFLWQMGVLPVI